MRMREAEEQRAALQLVGGALQQRAPPCEAPRRLLELVLVAPAKETLASTSLLNKLSLAVPRSGDRLTLLFR